jgi:hypothetical protein
VYRVIDRAGHPRTLTLLAAAGVVTTWLIGAGVAPVGVVCLGSAWAWAALRSRRTDGDAVVLRVSRGVLQVAGPEGDLLCARLDDVANVTLDSRTIRKVVEGHTLVPGIRFVEARVGPELEVVRIVIEVNGAEPTRLSETFVSHMDGVEWLGRIRRFLRAHGWIPEDEREADSSA